MHQRTRTVWTLLTIAAVLTGEGMAVAQSSRDVASLVCNFHFRIRGGGSGLDTPVDSPEASTDCDSYHIYLSAQPNPSQSTFRVSEQGTSGFMTYHLGDMPLDVPVLLLTPSREATRIIARRGIDRVDYTVGRLAFDAPPPGALLPRSSSRRELGHVSAGRSGASMEPGQRFLGSWRAQGLILELRPDGSFSRIGHTAPGQFGGLLDDHGTFEVMGDHIVLRGMGLTRTCSIGFTAEGEMVVCEVSYRRE